MRVSSPSTITAHLTVGLEWILSSAADDGHVAGVPPVQMDRHGLMLTQNAYTVPT
jgi:hypothetical protein